MTIGKNRRSVQTVAGLARSFRLGISATGLLMAGTALAPASAQVLNLNGLTVTRTDLTGFTEVTNGVLRINPVPAFSYGGELTDRLGIFSLTKIGGTTLTLTGSGLNTYSGLTTVSAGLLLAGADNVLSPNSVAAINAGRVDIAGFDQTVAGLTGGGQLENSGGAATVTVNTAGDLVYNGVISGNTTVVMNGTGRQNFGGTSTYSGGTILNSGTLGFVNSQAFGTGAITVAGAAELEAITLALTLANNIVLNADLTARFGQNVTWSGVVSGGAANQLIKEGNGILTLTGNNSYAGGTAFDRGQINVAGNSAFGTGTITTTATQVTMGTAGNVSAVVDNDIVLNGFMNFELPDVGNSLTLNGLISGPGALYLKTGNGTLILNSANTISVPTLLASGFLGLGDDAAAGTGTIRVSGTGGIAAYDNVAVANAIRTSNNTVVDTRGFAMALNGVIRDDSTGPGGIEKVGAGVLTLSADNVYTAETFVNAGTLILDGSIASDTFVASGATLGGSGSVADANVVNVSSGGIVAPGPAGGGAGTLTVGNLFLGAGSIFDVELSDPNVVGSSVNDLIIVTDTLTLDGATVNVLALPGFQSGTYRVMEFTNLAPGALLVAGSAPPTYSFTIDVNSALGQVNLLVAQSAIGPVQYWDGGDLAANGSVAGGNGTWNAANTNWTDSQGDVNGVWGGGTGIFQTVGGTVSVVGTQVFENLTFSVDGYVLNGGNLESNGSTLAVANGATTTINSAVTGTNGIVKTGSGNLVLNAANSYTDGTDVQGGTVTVGNDGALGTGDLTLRSNTTLAAGVAALNVGNDIVLAGNATINDGGFLFATPGTISGAGKLTKTGSGVLFLAGTNSYTGGTDVNAGSVVLYNPDSAGTGAIALANATQLVSAGGAFTTANAITITGNASLLTQGGSDVWTLSGIISDGGSAGTAEKNGPGTLVLTGNNSFSGGLTINAGTVEVGSNTAAGTGTITIGTGTTLAAAVSGLTLANDVTLGGLSTVDSGAGILTLDGAIGGGGTLFKDGAGTLVLTAANSYSGATFVIDGTVRAENNSAFGTGEVLLDNGTTLQAGAAGLVIANDISAFGTGILDTQAFDTELSGTLFDAEGSAGFDKIGSGTLTLSGVSDYTGDTDVDQGTLRVTGSLGNTAVTVASGATLSGTGSIGGAVEILDGGNLNPGTSPGTLTVGSLALNALSNLNYELGAVNTVAGPFNDLVIVTGNLTLDGLLNVTVPVAPPGGSFGTGAYQLFQYGGVLTDNGLTVNALPGGATSLVQTAIAGQVNLFVLTPGTVIQYWDGTDFVGNGTIDGGPGTWTETTTNWTGAAPSAINSDWIDGSVAVFAGATGTVTLADTFQAQGLQFTTSAYVLNGGGLDTGPALGTGTFIATNSGVFATINSQIIGGGAVVKQGVGTLILGGNNLYTGGTDLQAGVLTVLTNSALGTGDLAMATGTTLRSGNPGLDIGNDINVTGQGIIGTQGNVFTLSGIITDGGSAGSLDVRGAGGTLNLSGNNTYTGGTNVNSDVTVAVFSDSALGTGTLTLQTDATLTNGVTSVNVFNDITTVGNGIVNVVGSGDNLYAFGDIGGPGSISQVGAGNLHLFGNNSFTNLGINAGTVTVYSNTAAGIGAIAINNDATLAAGNNGLVLANFVTTTGNGLVDAGGLGNVFTLNGNIGGPGSISQVGLGNLVLNGNNSFTNLGINAGTVTLGTDTAAGIGTIAINNDATLAAGVTGLNIANDITTTANGLVDAGPAGFVFTLNGDIGGAGSISQVGLGNLVLNGNNSFTNLGINAGTVTLGTDTAAGIGTIAINNDATLAAGVTGLNIANDITTTANGLVDAGPAGFVFTLNGDIGGAGSISQVGLGNLVLNGNNSFTNLGINAGTVTLGTDTAAGIGTIAINNDATLAAGVSGLNIANDITTTANGLVDAGPAGFVFTLNGDIGGAGSISQVGLGNLVLNGNNSFTNLGINAGTVTLGTDTAAGIGTIAINNDATLAAGVSGLNIANDVITTANGLVDAGPAGFVFTLNGDIGGAGSISQVGLGNLVLNGNNSFTNLGINQGTVTLGTDTAAGIGTIAINNDATLAAGVSGLNIANDITTTANGLVDAGPAGFVFTLNGDIGGAGSISQVGLGNLVLNGNNSFTNLGINQGTVTLGTDTAAGIGTIAINNDATLAAGVSGLNIANDITTTANGLVDAGPAGFVFTLNGDIGGAGSISQVGLGNLVLNGDNSYTNLGINRGTVTRRHRYRRGGRLHRHQR